MVDDSKIMTTDMAQKTIQGCIDAYMEYLKITCGLTESTSIKYRSAANSVLKTITVPFFRIDNDTINNKIKDLYISKKWTLAHTGIVLNVITGLFYWARYIAPNAYTLKDITLINPRTDEVDKCSAFIAKITPSSTMDIKSKPSTNVKRTTNRKTNLTTTTIKQDETPTIKPDTIIKYNDDKTIIKRNKAVKLLIENSNITPKEVSKLMIFDFLHNRVVVQSQNCRSLMRVILINIDVRNAIYNYLITRSDSDEYLFESVYGAKAITEDEVADIAIHPQQ